MLSLRTALKNKNPVFLRSAFNARHAGAAVISLRRFLESGFPGPLLGKTTRSSPADCNNCAENLLAQLKGDPGLNIRKADRKFSVPHPRDKFKKHVQGVARLRDWNGMGRMLISSNMSDKGLRLAFQDVTGATEGVFSTKRKLKDPVDLHIRRLKERGDYDHPGGIQAVGDLVAIAMEKPKKEGFKYAAVYFVQVTGNHMRIINHLTLDGSRGEPLQEEKSHAATVGLVKLDTSHYLLAVAGRKHGKKGIWFYESDREEITPDTKWNYISIYRPAEDKIGFGKKDDDEFYVGAGGGLNFVTDCSGEIYLFAMHGTDTNPGDEFEYLQVFRVKRTEKGEIDLEKVFQQKDNLGKFATNSFSFRWAGGVYVSNTGKIAVMNTERRRNLGDNDYVDGAVYLGK